MGRRRRQVRGELALMLEGDRWKKSNLPGEHYATRMDRVPTDYLLWYVAEVKNLRYRDLAEIELIRRGVPCRKTTT